MDVRTITINAAAVDPADGTTGLATSVDNFFFERFVVAGAAAFLDEFADQFSDTESSIIINVGGGGTTTQETSAEASLEESLVAGLGDGSPRQGVDQGRLPDIGDAENHAHRGAAGPGWNQAPNLLKQARVELGLALLVNHGVHAITGVDVRQPLGGDVRVGQIRFVEDLDARPVAPELGDQRILTAERDPGVEDLDDQIDLGHGLALRAWQWRNS